MGDLEKYLHAAENKIKELEKSLENKIAELSQAQVEREMVFTQLIDTSRKALVGEMAGCIIHDISNAVSAIMGRNMQIRMMIEADKLKKESGIKFSTDIGNSSDRIAKTIGSLRTFCSGDYYALQTISVKDFISETLGIFGPRIRGSGVDLKVAEIDENYLCVCRPLEIAEVVINLLNASFDALRENEQKLIEIAISEQADSICLSISDNRKSNESSPKVTNAFPSPSKDSPAGTTAWTLYLSKILVEKNNGKLEQKSSTDKTTFFMTLAKPSP